MFVVLEIQTNADGAIGTLIFTFNSREEAESKYHLVLSAAAISALPVHAAVMMTNEGFILGSHYYSHGTGGELTSSEE